MDDLRGRDTYPKFVCMHYSGKKKLNKITIIIHISKDKPSLPSPPDLSMSSQIGCPTTFKAAKASCYRVDLSTQGLVQALKVIPWVLGLDAYRWAITTTTGGSTLSCLSFGTTSPMALKDSRGQQFVKTDNVLLRSPFNLDNSPCVGS